MLKGFYPPFTKPTWNYMKKFKFVKCSEVIPEKERMNKNLVIKWNDTLYIGKYVHNGMGIDLIINSGDDNFIRIPIMDLQGLKIYWDFLDKEE